MKKRSLFIVVAMVLLLAVVLGMGGTTFAKYITTKEVVNDSATVAKWGYVIEMATTELFGEKYAETTGVVDETNGKAVVSVDAGTNKVAPGTNGFMTFSINGKAEVMSQITVDVTSHETVTLVAEDYEPIKWTLSKKNGADFAAVSAALTDCSLDDLVAALEALHTTDGDRNVYDANETIAEEYKISWAWAFDNGNNTLDTKLGDFAAAAVAPDASIATLDVALAFTITVEQVEPNPAP